MDIEERKIQDGKNIQGIVITTLISLMTIVTVFGGFMSNQAKLEVQLTNIQKELVEIKETLSKRDEEIKQIKEDVIILKEKMK